MQLEENELIRVFKENYQPLHNRNEFFLVPVNNVINLRRLFHMAELENEENSSSDATKVMIDGKLYHRGNHGSLLG
jgi:hypothetical protein